MRSCVLFCFLVTHTKPIVYVSLHAVSTARLIIWFSLASGCLREVTWSWKPICSFCLRLGSIAIKRPAFRVFHGLSVPGLIPFVSTEPLTWRHLDYDSSSAAIYSHHPSLPSSSHHQTSTEIVALLYNLLNLFWDWSKVGIVLLLPSILH